MCSNSRICAGRYSSLSTMNSASGAAQVSTLAIASGTDERSDHRFARAREGPRQTINDTAHIDLEVQKKIPSDPDIVPLDWIARACPREWRGTAQPSRRRQARFLVASRSSQPRDLPRRQASAGSVNARTPVAGGASPSRGRHEWRRVTRAPISQPLDNRPGRRPTSALRHRRSPNP